MDGSSGGQVSRSRGPLLALAAIVLAFVTVSTWNLRRQGYALFYASAARSMSTSWRTLFFGGFDPSATITLDKLAGFLAPQALAVRLFGFHPWSLALPQVAEGVVTILACYLIGLRWRGVRTGLLAAGAAAATPLFASMFGHPMEDGLLTMSLACAFVCWQAAVRSGRWAPLVWAGVFVGVGFQAKMAQAWLVLPALALGTWLASGRPLRRLARAGVLLLVAGVASLAWTVAIQLVPATQRPFVDGTTDNNMLTMVLGFNGLDRLAPGSVPGAITGPASQSKAADSLTLGTGSTTGLFKLVGYNDVSQVGWLYPLALAGIGVAALGELAARRRAGKPSGELGAEPDTDEGEPAAGAAAAEPAAEAAGDLGTGPVRNSADERAPASVHDPAHGPTLIALVTWLAVAAALLSLAHVPHTAYLAAIGVAVAVLVGAGLDGVLTGLHSGGVRARRAAFVVVVTQVIWSAVVLVGYGGVPGALGATLTGAGVVAIAGAALAVVWRRVLAPRALTVFVLVGLLLAPAVWTTLVIDVHDAGTASDAYAGPRQVRNPVLAARAPASLTKFAPGVPWQGPDPTPDTTAVALARYVSERAPAGQGPVLLTDYWGSAASMIVWFGLDARAVGGYSGQAPNLSPYELKATIQAGRLPFALVHDEPRLVADGAERELSSMAEEDDDVVRALCSAVPAASWDRGHGLPGQTLYDCRR